MNKNKPRRSASASHIRAVERYKAEATGASRVNTDRNSSESSMSTVAISIPTVIRRIVEIVPVKGADDVPGIFQQTIDQVYKQQRNANRVAGVQLFNRRDGRFASKIHGLSGVDMFERINTALEDLDQSPLEARVSHYSIFGVKEGEKGMRFVAAVLDEASRRKLEKQSNAIKESVGLEPRRSLTPFHFAVFGTLDQQEAVDVLTECRDSSAKYCIELASPHIKTVVQRDVPPKFR